VADTYSSFSALAAAKKYDSEYRIRLAPRFSKVLVAGIHGGGIETGVSEMANYAMEKHQFSLYLFEGTKSSANSELHITSTVFDEPLGLKSFARSEYSVAFHGYGDSTNKNTKIGGADRLLREQMAFALVRAGFSCEILPDEDPISGTQADNIVNKNRRGMGVQLELSTAQRNAFFGTNTSAERRNTQTAEFYNYMDAVCSVLPKN
jgi:phage replication-related protein YjqB (UPF0714/DUF867 family)